MKKIVIISRFLKWASIGLIALLPLLEAGYWITNGYPFFPAEFKVNPLPVFGDMPVGWADLSEGQRLGGFLANMLPLVFFMVALGYLAKVFYAFEHLELFKRENAVILKNAGWALVWSQIAHVLSTGLLSLILTCHNPVGHRNLTLRAGSHQLEMLIIGLAILLISYLLAEAAKIQEENEATV